MVSNTGGEGSLHFRLAHCRDPNKISDCCRFARGKASSFCLKVNRSKHQQKIKKESKNKGEVGRSGEKWGEVGRSGEKWMSADQKHSKTQPSGETGHGLMRCFESELPAGLPVGLVHGVPTSCLCLHEFLCLAYV